MGSVFYKGNVDEKETKIHKQAIIDSKKKQLINIFYAGVIIFATAFCSFFSGGLILLIDGGITISYIITQIIYFYI